MLVLCLTPLHKQHKKVHKLGYKTIRKCIINSLQVKNRWLHIPSATFIGIPDIHCCGTRCTFFFMTASVFKAPSSEGAAEYVHNDSAPTVNACGRHVGCGQYDSQSPDGPLILPRQVAGRSVGSTSRLSGRTAPWKVWFGGSFGRTRQTRHLQFYRSVQARPGRGLKSLRLFFFVFFLQNPKMCQTAPLQYGD